jgi:hypothetical protein
VLVHDAEVQRRVAAVVLSIHSGPSPEQELDHTLVPLPARQQQQSVARGVTAVYRDPLCQLSL